MQKVIKFGKGTNCVSNQKLNTQALFPKLIFNNITKTKQRLQSNYVCGVVIDLHDFAPIWIWQIRRPNVFAPKVRKQLLTDYNSWLDQMCWFSVFLKGEAICADMLRRPRLQNFLKKSLLIASRVYFDIPLGEHQWRFRTWANCSPDHDRPW